MTKLRIVFNSGNELGTEMAEEEIMWIHQAMREGNYIQIILNDEVILIPISSIERLILSK